MFTGEGGERFWRLLCLVCLAFRWHLRSTEYGVIIRSFGIGGKNEEMGLMTGVHFLLWGAPASFCCVVPAAVLAGCPLDSGTCASWPVSWSSRPSLKTFYGRASQRRSALESLLGHSGMVFLGAGWGGNSSETPPRVPIRPPKKSLRGSPSFFPSFVLSLFPSFLRVSAFPLPGSSQSHDIGRSLSRPFQSFWTESIPPAKVRTCIYSRAYSSRLSELLRHCLENVVRAGRITVPDSIVFVSRLYLVRSVGAYRRQLASG